MASITVFTPNSRSLNASERGISNAEPPVRRMLISVHGVRHSEAILVTRRSRRASIACGWLAGVGLTVWLAHPLAAQGSAAANRFNDSHFHLTNYIQQGITTRQFLQIMGTRVGRSTLVGIPLQQQWSYANSGNFAPTYYLQSDAPLYYYSFTDAYIATVYRALTPAEQARFDPMTASAAAYFGVFETWEPVWRQLTPEASEKVRLKNYERLFDDARRKVRAWEKATIKEKE
jgi:hypothetical protein